MKKAKILNGYGFRVIIGNDSLEFLKKVKTRKIFILVDSNTREYCLPVLIKKSGISSEDLNIIEIAAGEQYKTLGACRYIWQTLIELGADRNSVLINLGGGVITDMGGFAASCFKRGINYINIPTTLMAQIDAAIGGKTGVNLDLLKNQIGVFKHPEMILIDTDFLKTLSKQHIVSGFAEILKYGLISDKKLWEVASKINTSDVNKWDDLIITCIKNKMDVVDKDPEEKNLRKVLNFGHTIGHAIETFIHREKKTITHGEAVAVGLIVESIISSKLLGLDKNIIQEIFNVINGNFLLPQFTENDISELVNLMMHDKKNIDNKINFTLIEDIGKARIDQFCETSVIKDSGRDYLVYLSHAETQRC